MEQLQNALVILHKIDPTLMQALKAEIEQLWLQVQNGELQSINQANQNRATSDRSKVNGKRKTQINPSTHQKKLGQQNKEQGKKVKVEVLEPESEDPQKSQYEAVMKIKQLL